jgi:hypothetical protein
MLKISREFLLSNNLDDSGMAAIEIIPMIVIIMFLVVFSLGFFGVIHTGILNSVGARNYAFETFRHRADLRYIREKYADPEVEYYQRGSRFHATVDVGSNIVTSNFPATARRIDFLKPGEVVGGTEARHNEVLRKADLNRRILSDAFGVNPVWIKVKYGICLDVSCGGT